MQMTHAMPVLHTILKHNIFTEITLNCKINECMILLVFNYSFIVLILIIVILDQHLPHMHNKKVRN